MSNFYVTEEELDSYSEFVRSRMKQTGIHELDILHALVLGIVGEWFEVQELIEQMDSTTSSVDMEKLNGKLRKEHGDMLFYFRASFNILNITNSRIVYDMDVGPATTYKSIFRGLGDLLDLTKRRYVYRQERVLLEQAVVDLWNTICEEWADTYGEDYLRIVLVENEEKVTKRYPNGFSTLDSLLKVDEQ